VFERFTDAARRVVVGAQAEAHSLNHHYIGTEHLLLGIMHHDAGEADDGEEMIHVPGEHFARLVAEVARLRELLRHHGIDPDEQLPPEPGFGDDDKPPVA
jgi:ATP-dependent Clp protease ATP-binding subunit ClpA